MKKALEGLKGVNRADVSLRRKEAVVTFDPAHVTVAKMIEAVDRLGFRATVRRVHAGNAPGTSQRVGAPRPAGWISNVSREGP